MKITVFRLGRVGEVYPLAVSFYTPGDVIRTVAEVIADIAAGYFSSVV